MSFTSKIVFLVSLLQILHSGFSSHEFVIMKQRLAANSDLNVDALFLPKDVQIEALCGVLLLALSIFLSFGKQEFLPLSGKLTVLRQEGVLQEIRMNKATIAKNLAGCNPYGEITNLPSFVDVHAKRTEVRRWREEQMKSEAQ
ncbi:LAFA_0D13806g1_1 [Lachancea sp. 'fantastica']|nr:LAFA_0D13806g1_1 [Lachancea sp. 'fantastica']